MRPVSNTPTAKNIVAHNDADVFNTLPRLLPSLRRLEVDDRKVVKTVTKGAVG